MQAMPLLSNVIQLGADSKRSRKTNLRKYLSHSGKWQSPQPFGLVEIASEGSHIVGEALATQRLVWKTCVRDHRIASPFVRG
jgi:hypothetical protein